MLDEIKNIHQLVSEDLKQEAFPLSDTDVIKKYAGFFDLLDQIDGRLKNEDREYKAKYYPEEI